VSSGKGVIDALRGVLVMNERVVELSRKVERLERDLTLARENADAMRRELSELRGFIRGALASTGRSLHGPENTLGVSCSERSDR
jgi:hypothetical protein